MRNRLYLFLAISALSLAGSARYSAAGDWAPVLSCESSTTDSTQTLITLLLHNHASHGVCRVALDPAAVEGLAPVPLTGVSCPAGWTCQPDSIAGGLVYLGCIRSGYLSPAITIQAPARSVPTRLTFSEVDGSYAEIRFKILTCPTTPALPWSWGRLKGAYR